MASEVDICNLALGHLGDDATVSSLSPPEGSAQADHCARFYPIARDSMLEMHAWGFATKRTKMALVTSTWPEWRYAYAQPNDVLNLLAVMPPNVTDDYNQVAGYQASRIPVTDGLGYVPQPYSAETDDAGGSIIYTDQADAVLRYTVRVTDATKFSPLFIMTLSYHLASMLAGPVIKGDEGKAEAKRCAAIAMQWLGKAEESDANQRRVVPVQNVGWIAGR